MKHSSRAALLITELSISLLPVYFFWGVFSALSVFFVFVFLKTQHLLKKLIYSFLHQTVLNALFINRLSFIKT